MRIFRIVLAVVCFSLPLTAQNVSPQQALASFQHASKSTLHELAKQYELKDDRGYVCQELNASTLPWTGDSFSAVLIKSPDCQMSFVLPYWRIGAVWKYGETIDVYEHDANPTVSIKQLVAGQSPAIVIMGNPVLEGTGWHQENLQIFMLVDGKTKLVLNEPSHIFFRTSFSNGSHSLTTDSTFKFATRPASGDDTAISEVRKATVEIDKATNRKSTVVEYHTYTWEPRWKVLERVVTSPDNL